MSDTDQNASGESQMHYVCDGTCGGVSPVPGVCQTPGCPNFGQPLKDCDCTDGKHLPVWPAKPVEPKTGL